MTTSITVQGRKLNQADLAYIQNLIINNPDDSRRRLSIKLYNNRNYNNNRGQEQDKNKNIKIGVKSTFDLYL